jgi:hypothetical protein
VVPIDKLTRRRFLRASLTVFIATGLGILTRCSRRKKCSLDSLKIISRAEWGAVEPRLDSVEGVYDPVANSGGWLVYDEPLEKVLTTIIVHHSALPLSDGPREIQQMHFEFKGYADIAYHFLIDETGQIYEGRSLTVRGAHAGGHNTGTVGVVLLGNFMVDDPTEAQLVSLRTLSACLIDEYSITHMAGHRDFQPGVTDCPGDHLEILLPDLAAEMVIKFGTEGYAGP